MCSSTRDRVRCVVKEEVSNTTQPLDVAVRRVDVAMRGIGHRRAEALVRRGDGHVWLEHQAIPTARLEMREED